MGCGGSKEGGVQKKDDQPAAAQANEAPKETKAEGAAPAAEKKEEAAAAPAAAAAAPAPAKPKDSKGPADRKSAWDKIKARLPRSRSDEDKQKRADLFKQFDPNGNGKLSLAEIDKGAREILNLDEFTDHLSPVLIRAYKKAAEAGGKEGDAEFVEAAEFRLLMCYIYDFFELHVMFDEVDTTDDGRISKEEFTKALPKIEAWGLKINDPDAAFAAIDTDKGGMILFVEFAEWAAKKKLSADGDPDNAVA